MRVLFVIVHLHVIHELLSGRQMFADIPVVIQAQFCQVVRTIASEESLLCKSLRT